jgi:hypothetical protein
MKNIERENLMAELELHKLEFSALYNEIIQLAGDSRQYLNLNLIAIGAAFGFFPFVLEKEILVALLVYPFLFHVLFQQMLSVSKKGWKIETYVSFQLIPRVNRILDELGSKRNGIMTLGWQIRYFYPVFQNPKRIASMSPTENWVPVLTISGLLISYAMIASAYHYSISLAEIILFLVNIILLVGVILQSGIAARKEVRNTQELAIANGINLELEHVRNIAKPNQTPGKTISNKKPKSKA